MRIAEEMSTPELVRTLVTLKEEAVRNAFASRAVKQAEHNWLSQVVDELRSRNVLD